MTRPQRRERFDQDYSCAGASACSAACNFASLSGLSVLDSNTPPPCCCNCGTTTCLLTLFTTSTSAELCGFNCALTCFTKSSGRPMSTLRPATPPISAPAATPNSGVKKIDPATKEPQYKVIGKADWHTHIEGKINAKGICGSAIIDVVAEMFKAGVIDKTGKFVMDCGSNRVRKDAGGKPEYVLAWADETSINQDITVTQGDVRALQLAKGALYTGTKLMMQKMGVTKLDRVELAGAFGSHIDREASLTLGIFPDVPIEKVVVVGNAAGDGARMTLLNRGKRTEAEERARWVNFVEIATEPAFEKEFMMAMHIPHMKDKFPNLKALLEEQKAPIAASIKG